MTDLKELCDARRSLDLCESLTQTSSFKATDPRNKIFALVGPNSCIEAGFIEYELDASKFITKPRNYGSPER